MDFRIVLNLISFICLVLAALAPPFATRQFGGTRRRTAICCSNERICIYVSKPNSPRDPQVKVRA